MNRGRMPVALLFYVNIQWFSSLLWTISYNSCRIFSHLAITEDQEEEEEEDDDDDDSDYTTYVQLLPVLDG